MNEEFNALVANKDEDGNFSVGVEALGLNDLPDENVLIDIDYSTLNYKDGLVVTKVKCVKNSLWFVG